MKITDQKIRSMLAAEYALGTLRGRARERFRLWLRSDPGLRREVVQWEQRLQPLSATVEEVTPDPAVWNAIQRQIAPAVRPDPPSPGGWWQNIAFWRGFSLATASVAAVMFGYVALTPVPHSAVPDEAMVVVMSDPQTDAPAMTVAWTPGEKGQPRLRVKVIGHQTMEPDTAWELWMVPAPGQAPRSLGLITTHETQTVDVPSELRAALDAAAGLAMSVEPKGGSPTGQPSGPVLYSGPCVKI